MALIRPATVLSFLLFIAFAFLLVSVLTAPIIKGLALATNNGVTFGVFGYCTGSGKCTGIQVGGYNVGTLSPARDFSLPSNARITLTNLLIIHPVACLLVLILFVLTLITHLYTPGHSPGYLLFLIFFSIFTCVVAILAFLVDILLFVPHLAAGGYIVVGAPICLAIVVIGLCASRRRVVNKEERKRRIAEAASNNASNLNSTSNAGFGTAADAGKIPGAVPEYFSPSADSDKLPEFAAFEVGKTAADVHVDNSEGRIPLDPRHQSPPPVMGMDRAQMDSRVGGYNQPSPMHSPLEDGSNYPNGTRSPRGFPASRNGAPLPPSHRLPLNQQNNAFGGSAFGPGPGNSGGQYGSPRYGQGHRGPRGSPSPGPVGSGAPYKNGANFPPGYGPRGPMMGPNNPNFPPEPRSGRFDNQYHGDTQNYGPGLPIVARGMSPGMIPPGPRRGPSAASQSAEIYYSDAPQARQGLQNFPPEMGYAGSGRPRRSPPPMQQLAELPVTDASKGGDENTGEPNSRMPTLAVPTYGVGGPVVESNGGGTRADRITSSIFGIDDENGYIPPRAQWQNNTSRDQTAPSELPGDDAPVSPSKATSPTRNLTPLRDAGQPGQGGTSPAVELAAEGNFNSHQDQTDDSRQQPARYYEDVDPRFNTRSPDTSSHRPPYSNYPDQSEGLPPALIAGYRPYPGAQSGPLPRDGSPLSSRPNYKPTHEETNVTPVGDDMPIGRRGNGHPPPVGAYSYDDAIGPGPRGRTVSTISEQTNFTSISQRPINPRWTGGTGQQQNRNRPTLLLSGNPDFELSGSRGAGARIPGTTPQGLGGERGGRYPCPPPPPNPGR